MIVIFHHNNTIVSVETDDKATITFSKGTSLVDFIFKMAEEYPMRKIVWCHQSLQSSLNTSFIKSNSAYQQTLYSYNPSSEPYLSDAIAYMEHSPFINVNKKLTYPTWLMSSAVGYAQAAVFLKIKQHPPSDNLDYFLNSIAKIYMPLGLFCYSEPQLLLSSVSVNHKVNTASTQQLFKFVKQHFRTRWVFLLLFDLVVYEKKCPLFSFLTAFLCQKVQAVNYSLAEVPFLAADSSNTPNTVDVLIPTIGRKQYLYDVLCDLKKQTLLPSTVIIVEQNFDPSLESELDYLTTESWPFAIKHTFTKQLGACNARNIALSQLESKWVFFADDDVRFGTTFLEECLQNCIHFGKKAITISCLREGETLLDGPPVQWETFGTCSSFVAREAINNLRFNMGFEFGYGEDADYGKKIRDQGTDVVFFTKPSMLHLKAPIGGFRTKFSFEWEQETILPKPSPTVMLYKLLYCTPKELLGYKTVLFFKYYPKQNIKNPFAYASYFKKQWNQSVKWAKRLETK
ncbi:glycosyltransferase family A protein [Flavobacterium sp. SUN046]|uniref:glycosyltransferase family 2 protein n=1 Tax=Flavobacterium sp. SUN046 TaxID=3002440 RepID=UPI002DB5C76C|nr:glycosyltransferase family A protein [Flavobacterium sp. SUN046]MEC4050912.1 glycosyltransferase family A protein [Flavobacterium sp. SUN046]